MTIPLDQKKALKHSLPQYLKKIGHIPDVHGTKLSARCPIHPDTNPSFSADLKPDGWVWFCHACSEGGDILSLHSMRREIDLRQNFALVCREVREILSADVCSPADVSRNETDQAAETQSVFDSAQFQELTTTWRWGLYRDQSLQDQFARELGIGRHILQEAAKLGFLGVAPAGHVPRLNGRKPIQLREPRLVYIGDGYFKIRAPFGTKHRTRFWKEGSAKRPWMSDLLVNCPSHVRDLHLHESESSALALVASGFWSRDGSAIVVATGGCSGFKTEWALMFAGKVVHFWPDCDDAGRNFVENAANCLYGVAAKILVHDWNLQHESFRS